MKSNVERVSCKYSVILGNLGNTCDRFLSSGYKDVLPPEERYSQAAKIPFIKGVELIGTWDINKNNIKEIKKRLKDNKLECVSIIPDLFSQKRWGKGSFSSKDKKIRQESINETKMMMDIAVELECPLVNLWLGQDGYDYCLQGDYITDRKRIVEGIRECAEYRKDIKLALEYKLKEPRTHSYLARVSDTILMAKQIDCDNVGITVDVGHAFMAYENVAESVALLKMSGDLLLHMHFNDNFRLWDDDMIVGSVHFVEYIELLFWLKKIGYNGWYSMDQYPYREDGPQAISESIMFLKKIDDLLSLKVIAEMDKLILEGNATKSSKFIRELIFRDL